MYNRRGRRSHDWLAQVGATAAFLIEVNLVRPDLGMSVKGFDRDGAPIAASRIRSCLTAKG